ncbi:putative multi antimicrobial extrusion protein [Rosa chinensis]|uniref:Protein DETOXIFICATION n=1 Tax=Rosa chinensis TaxID=74649 RepID=A0A2P6PHD6_ROSCH|nr:putative multi antimicrobial extrusion protein [Rosa chinensis]
MDVEEERYDLESLLIPNSQEHAIESRKGFLNKDEIFEEVKKQLLLIWPLVSSNFLLFVMQVISVMYVGHLGELSLAGASMATSFASVTGLSLILGMYSALDTFCGQSFGAKQYRMLGIHMQRAMLILLLVSVPLAIIWANAGNILQCLGQDPQISSAAGDYARLMIPCIFAYAILQCHARFLQTQRNVIPMIASTGTATLLHLLTCWVMVYKTSLGSRGAAVANAITYWINALFLFIYVRVSPSCKNTWTGFSKEAFHVIPTFLKLSIPSALMSSLEMWSFEMLVLVSGLLPNPKLETSVLSISTRVSNQLGAGQPQLARLAACVALCLVITEGIVGRVSNEALSYWRFLPSLTASKRIQEENKKSKTKTVLQLFQSLLIKKKEKKRFHNRFIDNKLLHISGIIRGSGRQKIGAYVNLGAYYLIGIPTGLLFAFNLHIGGKGLWIGIILALCVQSLFLAIIVLRTDWDKEVK